MNPRCELNVIGWPTEEEIHAISPQLSQISQDGTSSEPRGDYFRSGDIAYQLQEILCMTRELLKKSQRAKG